MGRQTDMDRHMQNVVFTNTDGQAQTERQIKNRAHIDCQTSKSRHTCSESYKGGNQTSLNH